MIYTQIKSVMVKPNGKMTVKTNIGNVEIKNTNVNVSDSKFFINKENANEKD